MQASLYDQWKSRNDRNLMRDQKQKLTSLMLYELSVYQAHMGLLLRTKFGAAIQLIKENGDLKDLADQLEVAMRHKIPPRLIRPEDLMNTIEVTNKYLRNKYPRYRVAFADSGFYYENVRAICYKDKNEIVIRISIPIVSGEHIFSVYQIRTYPVPVRVAGKKADGTIINNIPTEVAISRNGLYYITTPVVNWARCRGESVATCPDVPHMRKVTEDSCMAGLIRNDLPVIKRVCDIRYIIRPEFPPMAIALTNGRMLITGPEIRGQLMCGSLPPQVITIHHAGIVKMPCDCAFMSAGSWINYSLRGCGTKLTRAVVGFVINDLLDMGTAKQEWTKAELNGSPIKVLTEDPLEKSTRYRLEKRAEKANESISVRLRQLAREEKTGRLELEMDMSEINEEREYGNSMKSHLYTGGMIMMVIVMVIAICCCCKFRRELLGGMILTSRGAQAEPMWGMDKPSAIPDRNGMECSEQQTVIAILTVIMITLIIICIYMGRKLKRMSREKLPDGLYLQISSNNVAETIQLGECNMPMDHLFQSKVTQPLITNMNISYACRGHVARIKWGRTLYASETPSGERAMPLPLPCQLRVSRQLARTYNNDTVQVITARLMRYAGGLASLVPMEQPAISAAGWSTIGMPMATHYRQSTDARQPRPSTSGVRGHEVPANRRRIPNAPPVMVVTNSGEMTPVRKPEPVYEILEEEQQV